MFTGEHAGTGRLERGGMVLLYTDGIVERPCRSLAEASVELARAATDVAADRAFRNGLPLAERVCVQTLELLTRTTGHSDDITMLTGRRLDPSAPLRLHFPARIEELAPLRARLSEWLVGCGAGQADNEAVRHAVAELATNSITHAYAGDGGDEHDCVVTADLDVTGEVETRVSDHGRWREPHPSSDSGYGMRMAAGLVDSLLVGLRRDTSDPDVSPDPGQRRSSRPNGLVRDKASGA